MVSTRTGGKIQAVIFRCKEKPEVLILHYRPEHGSFWQTVTGNVELNEDLLDSLIREVKEETGLGKECIINVYPDIYSFDFHAHDMDFHETVFAVMVRPDCNVDISRNVDKEHDEFKWEDFESAAQKVKWYTNAEAIRRAAKLADSLCRLDSGEKIKQ